MQLQEIVTPMKFSTLLVAGISATLMASPVFANPIMKDSPNSAQNYGDGSAAQQQTQSTRVQSSSRSSSSAHSSSRSVGNVTNVYNSPGDGSGNGAGVADRSAGTSSGLTGGTFTVRNVPDVFVPSVGGGGADCPVVGFGLGGAGPGAGGGIGPSWLSSDCNTRKLAELIASLGYRAEAIELLKNHFDEVKDAFASDRKDKQGRPGFFGRLFNSSSEANPAVQQASATAPAIKPDWCWTASDVEKRRHPECR
jgi:hypothetical protein